MSFEKKPALALSIGLAASTKITPLVRVLDANGDPCYNTSVTLEIDSIETQTTSDSPVCDTATRKQIAGTLEYLRLSQVCRVSMINSTVYTDTLGQAPFSSLKMEM